MKDMDRLSRTTSDTSEIRLRLFALGFLGLLCAMMIGFVSASRALGPNSVDYGYDQRLGAQSLSQSGAERVSNCPAIARQLPGRPRTVWKGSG